MDEGGQVAVGADRQAQMEAIVSTHESALLRYATRILQNPASAEDVVQNVFIKLFRGWQEGMHPTDKLKAWLYRVTHNEAVDLIRRESRLRLLHEKQAAEVGEPVCTDGVHCTPEEEKRLAVMRHLRRLSPTEQQVVLLRLEEGRSYRDISQITGRTEGNVGNILHHAVRKLSARLQKAGAA
jgi:RNA polymerase sigma factor (sigma-70 family)